MAENEEIKKEAENPENTQVFNIVTGRDPSWQSIIYELIASEQLDPWNIDIGILCRSYFERIRELEEGNFHISSKILLAAALLLRIKSDILLHRYLREIDNVLFKREDEVKRIIERIEIDDDEIPILSPKTPLPRFKKVTLQELIDALDVAIKTEGRRINKEIQKKQAERLAYIDIPKFKRINIKDRIRHFYAKVLASLKSPKFQAMLKIPYSHFTGNSKEEKIACFLPMLYLSNHGKVWLEQEKHFSEIYLYLYEAFKKAFPEYDKALIEPEAMEDIREELLENFEEAEQELEKNAKTKEAEKQKRAEKINKDSVKADDFSDSPKPKKYKPEDFGDFENPIGDMIPGED